MTGYVVDGLAGPGDQPYRLPFLHHACLNCYRRSTYLRVCLVCSSHPRHRVRDLSWRQRARTTTSPTVRHVYGRLVWGLR